MMRRVDECLLAQSSGGMVMIPSEARIVMPRRTCVIFSCVTVLTTSGPVTNM
jgi:hypothetical protein